MNQYYNHFYIRRTLCHISSLRSSTINLYYLYTCCVVHSIIHKENEERNEKKEKKNGELNELSSSPRRRSPTDSDYMLQSVRRRVERREKKKRRERRGRRTALKIDDNKRRGCIHESSIAKRRCVWVSLSTVRDNPLYSGPDCRPRRSRRLWWHCCRRFVRKQHFRRSRWRQEEGLTYLRHNKNRPVFFLSRGRIPPTSSSFHLHSAPDSPSQH